MDRALTANTLGALALTLADRVTTATTTAAEHGASMPAALVTLRFESGLSIEQLRCALGLTHSGGVRLVDRLAADGLVERRPGAGRRVTLVLTDAGRRAAQRAIDARRGALEPLLDALSASEAAQLQVLVAKLLEALVSGEDEARRTCRLCDGDACPDERCPLVPVPA